MASAYTNTAITTRRFGKYHRSRLFLFIRNFIIISLAKIFKKNSNKGETKWNQSNREEKSHSMISIFRFKRIIIFILSLSMCACVCVCVPVPCRWFFIFPLFVNKSTFYFHASCPISFPFHFKGKHSFRLCRSTFQFDGSDIFEHMKRYIQFCSQSSIGANAPATRNEWWKMPTGKPYHGDIIETALSQLKTSYKKNKNCIALDRKY